MEKVKKTISGEIFGDSRALISTAGNPYIKATILHTTDDGEKIFVNASFFPAPDDVTRTRDLLCRGRLVEATGNYSEREYVGKDGTDKIAHDLLVHSVKIGVVKEWDGGRKTTEITVSDEAMKASGEVKPKVNNSPKATTSFVQDDDFLAGMNL